MTFLEPLKFLLDSGPINIFLDPKLFKFVIDPVKPKERHPLLKDFNHLPNGILIPVFYKIFKLRRLIFNPISFYLGLMAMSITFDAFEKFVL